MSLHAFVERAEREREVEIMVLADDPFIHYLRSISGQTIHYFPGDHDFDGVLASLSLFDLCRRCGVECVPHPDGDDVVGELVILGAGHVAAADEDEADRTARQRLLQHNRIVLAPRSVSRFEEIEGYIGHDVTIFCRDEPSSTRARLQGIASQRIHVCRDLSVHIDHDSLATPASGRGEGVVIVSLTGRSADPTHDVIDLRFARGGKRRASHNAWRSLARGAAELMNPYAEVWTDGLGVAVLAAGLGKTVVLAQGVGEVNADVFETSIKPMFATLALAVKGEGADGAAGPDPTSSPDGGGRPEPGEVLADRCERLQRELRAARQDIETLRQDNDIAFASRLSKRLDSDVRRSTLVLAEEMGTASHAPNPDRRPRLVPIGRLDQEIDDAKRAFESRLAEAERDQAAHLDRVNKDAEARLAETVAAAAAASREVGERRVAEESRHSAEMQVLNARLAALDRLVAVKSQQLLGLQTALDDQAVLQRVTETKSQLMRALIDSRSAAVAASRREADDARRLLQTLLASRSWRAFRPLRAVARTVRSLAGGAG